MKKALFKETLRSISRSKARFISIIAIVALGISFFAGIKATAPDMKETAELYVQDTNMMDVRVISQAGLTEEDLEAMQQIDGVDTIVPGRFVDGILQADGKSIGDMDGSEMTVRAMGLDFAQAFDYAETGEASADYMNRVTLLEGRMPENENECLVDGSTLSAPEQFKVGAKIGIAGDGTNIENKMDVTEFTIVGIVRTPLYLSFERGYTNVGSGKLGTFIYVSNDVFNFDYYTEAYMTVSGAANYSTYSEEYDEFITPVVEALKDLESVRLPLRVEALREEYTPIVADGEAELAEQEANYDQQVADAEAQIAEMKDLAENGQAKIDAKKKEFNDSLSAAQKEIYDGTDEYNSQYAEWREKYDQLNEAKLNLTKLETATDDYNSAKAQLDNAKSQIDSANQQIEATEEIVVGLNNSLEYFQNYQNDQEQTIKDWITGVGLPEDVADTIYDSFSSLTAMGTAEEMIAYMEPMLKQYNETLNQQKQQLAQATAEYNENKAKLDAASAIISQYQNAKQEVTEAEIELEEYERQLNDAGVDLKVGQLELNSNQQQLQSQISMAEMQLAAAQTQLETAEAELEAQKQSGAEELEKENPGKPVVVHTDLTVVDEGLTVINDSLWRMLRIEPSLLTDLNRMGAHCLMTGCTMIFDKKVKEVSLPISQAAVMHDIWITLCVFKNKGVIGEINYSTILYRQHGENTVGAKDFQKNYVKNKLKGLKTVWQENLRYYNMLRLIGYGSVVKYIYNKINYYFKYNSLHKNI